MLKTFFYLNYAAKKPSDIINLPRPEEFSKALYSFDIGQNDLSVGFRKLSFDQLRTTLPDIINHLASAVQVSNLLNIKIRYIYISDL